MVSCIKKSSDMNFSVFCVVLLPDNLTLFLYVHVPLRQLFVNRSVSKCISDMPLVGTEVYNKKLFIVIFLYCGK